MTHDEFVEISKRFRRFAETECRGSSPLYEALSHGAADDGDLLGLLTAAAEEQRRPNLLFAAVHFLLLSGPAHPLRNHYSNLTEETEPPDKAFPAFRDFCLSRRGELREVISTRFTQTNDVGRSGQLMLGFLRAAEMSGHVPLTFLEVGASAGLNLLFDRFHFRYDTQTIGDAASSVRLTYDMRGDLRPDLSAGGPTAADRVGIDLSPLDADSVDDQACLRACIWPEHAQRRALLDGALEIARKHKPEILRGNGVDLLPEVVARVPDETPVCVFHSATLVYFSDHERQRFEQVMFELSRDRQLYWASAEATGVIRRLVELHDRVHTPPPQGAFALVGLSHLHRGARSDQLLARCDLHGTWIECL